MTPGLGYGDAIGVDVLGMYAELQNMGVEVFVFTINGSSTTALPTYHYADTRWLLPHHDDLLIYHYGTWDSAAMTELRRQKCRVAIKFHNVTPSKFMLPYSADFAAGTKRAYNDIARLVQLPIELYLCDSEFNAQELQQLGAPKGRTIALPCFHSADSLLQQNDDEAIVRQLSASAFNLLTVSRIVPNKNFERMLVALDVMVREKRFSGCLHIVGSRDPRLKGYSDELDGIVATTGLSTHVRFHGSVSPTTLATLYRYSDLYWTTSQHEGLGVPLIEAMAFGMPIVSSRMGALPETCGEAALYADTTADCIQVLSSIVENDKLRANLKKLSNERYRAVYRSDIIASEFRAALDVVKHLGQQRVEASVLDIAGDWFGIPTAEAIVRAAALVSPALPPNAFAGRDRRMDFIDWILRDGWRQSSELENYLSSPEFLDFARRIQVPRMAEHLSSQMRLAWTFSRFAQSSFDLRTSEQTRQFVRWYDRELASSYWKPAPRAQRRE